MNCLGIRIMVANNIQELCENLKSNINGCIAVNVTNNNNTKLLLMSNNGKTDDCFTEYHINNYIDTDIVVTFANFKIIGEEYVIVNNTIKKCQIVDGISAFDTKYAMFDGILSRFQKVSLDNVVELSNGKYLINEYGKYNPNISFINDVPDVEHQWKAAKKEDFNLPKGDVSVIYGNYFVSKKGTKCFEINPNGNHLIIKDNWGGSFNKYRGRTLPQETALYYRRATSNGGGNGIDYAVFPKNWKYLLNEEDI